jgi:hypothetical protein
MHQKLMCRKSEVHPAHNTVNKCERKNCRNISVVRVNVMCVPDEPKLRLMKGLLDGKRACIGIQRTVIHILWYSIWTANCPLEMLITHNSNSPFTFFSFEWPVIVFVPVVSISEFRVIRLVLAREQNAYCGTSINCLL